MTAIAEPIQESPTVDLVRIKSTVLALPHNATVEQCATIINMVDSAMSRAKDLKHDLELVLIEWIKANGDLTIGPVRYYLGSKKTYKLNSAEETLGDLLSLTGGKVDRIAALMSASPFKPAATRDALAEMGEPDLFYQLFETIEETELREGKPVKVKKLQRVDTRFAE